MKKLLVIEDDLWISKSLKLYLESSWFEVILYHTWENVIEFIKITAPDLIILDVNLPFKNGIEITKELRKTEKIPIVMLTARWEEDDKVNWLEAWADDYISKPFSPRELLARINSIIRRTNLSETEKNENPNLVKIFDLEVDLEKNIVKKNDEILNLTSNEFEILRKMIELDWAIVSRENMMKDVFWYENYAYDRTIDTHIKNLRKKLWDSNYILTVRWVWYRLNIN